MPRKSAIPRVRTPIAGQTRGAPGLHVPPLQRSAAEPSTPRSPAIDAVISDRRPTPRAYSLLGLAAAVATLGLSLGSLLGHHHGRPSDMLRVGSQYGQLAGLSLVRFEDAAAGTSGFDGQFFLYVARDPLVTAPTQEALDLPRLRARRLGFPLIGATLAATGLGPARGLLLAEALASLGLIAVVQAAARRHGLSPLWCLAVPLCLPFALSLELVTAELPAAFFVVAAAEAHDRKRSLLAVFALAAACITKEVALAAPLAFAAWELIRGRARNVTLWLSACLPFVLWEGYLLWQIPRGGAVTPLLANLALPGEGVVRALVGHAEALTAAGTGLKAAGLLLAICWYLAGAAGALILCTRKRTPARMLAAAGGLLVLLLGFGGGPQAYNEVFNFGRQLFLLPTAAVIALFQERSENTIVEARATGIWLAAGSILGTLWILQEIVF